MFELKLLSPEAVPAALEKALRYRLLNEPEQAASRMAPSKVDRIIWHLP